MAFDIRGYVGLKTGVKNAFLWSEIGPGFEEPGGTPPPRNPRGNPLPGDGICHVGVQGTLGEDKQRTLPVQSSKPEVSKITSKGVCLSPRSSYTNTGNPLFNFDFEVPV